MSFADADGGEPGYDEDEYVMIQEKTKEHKKEVTSGLRRVDKLVQETNKQASETNVEIRRQGEVISGIEEKVDHTNESLNYADHLVKGIDSIMYALNPFKKKKKKPTKSAEPDPDLSTAKTDPSTASRMHKATHSKAKHVSSEQMADQETVTGFSKEDQQSLSSIHHGLETLKEQMIISGDQLEQQNKDLDRLNPKVQQVNTRMAKTTNKIEKLC